MKTFRFTLDKRRGSQYVHLCKACKKREFRRYVDTHNDNAYLDDTCGRCNREIKCGYHLPPRELFKQDPSKIPKGGSRYTSIDIAKPVPDFLKDDCIEKSMSGTYTDNNFTRWLRSLSFIDAATYIRLVERYKLGGVSIPKDAVVFWQIDINGNIRTGKIMLYDPQTGRRIKDPKIANKIGWVHNELKKREQIKQSFSLVQCFFGEHLLAKHLDDIVAVFESPKTAVVASVIFPNMVCIASDGLNGLNVEKCRPLAGRQVIFFPDLQCAEKWRTKIREISLQVPFAKWELNTVLETEATDEQRANGWDLCDYIIQELTNSNN